MAAKLLALGYTAKEVAEDIDYPVERIKVLMRSTMFKLEIEKQKKRQLDDVQAHLTTRMKERADKTLDNIEEMADSPGVSATRLNANKIILDRILPHEENVREPVQQIVVNISSADVKHWEDTLAEDAEYEVVEEDNFPAIEDQSEPGTGDN